jgi:hypothetical protein
MKLGRTQQFASRISASLEARLRPAALGLPLRGNSGPDLPIVRLSLEIIVQGAEPP